mmetsp:Transcript_106123/g.342278  ORF Transcript_106123/g.342278 Transcript_106123/m.342278 type:complete len:606 (+) Transcript_106123:1-1818(+)
MRLKKFNPRRQPTRRSHSAGQKNPSELWKRGCRLLRMQGCAGKCAGSHASAQKCGAVPENTGMRKARHAWLNAPVTTPWLFWNNKALQNWRRASSRAPRRTPPAREVGHGEVRARDAGKAPEDADQQHGHRRARADAAGPRLRGQQPQLHVEGHRQEHGRQHHEEAAGQRGDGRQLAREEAGARGRHQRHETEAAQPGPSSLGPLQLVACRAGRLAAVGAGLRRVRHHAQGGQDGPQDQGSCQLNLQDEGQGHNTMPPALASDVHREAWFQLLSQGCVREGAQAPVVHEGDREGDQDAPGPELGLAHGRVHGGEARVPREAEDEEADGPREGADVGAPQQEVGRRVLPRRQGKHVDDEGGGAHQEHDQREQGDVGVDPHRDADHECGEYCAADDAGLELCAEEQVRVGTVHDQERDQREPQLERGREAGEDAARGAEGHFCQEAIVASHPRHQQRLAPHGGQVQRLPDKLGGEGRDAHDDQQQWQCDVAREPEGVGDAQDAAAHHGVHEVEDALTQAQQLGVFLLGLAREGGEGRRQLQAVLRADVAPRGALQALPVLQQLPRPDEGRGQSWRRLRPQHRGGHLGTHGRPQRRRRWRHGRPRRQA